MLTHLYEFLFHRHRMMQQSHLLSIRNYLLWQTNGKWHIPPFSVATRIDLLFFTTVTHDLSLKG